VQQVGGYNPTLIAGEEPELCVRLRQNGGKILRLDGEMTRHDAQMTRFQQWWKRSQRAGHAYAEGAWLHGAPPERHWVADVRRIAFWGLGVPLVAITAAWWTRGLSLLLLLGYPVMVYKIFNYYRRSLPSKPALLYAWFCMLGKFPQAQGVLQFYWNKFSGKRSTLIEYNSVPAQKSAI